MCIWCIFSFQLSKGENIYGAVPPKKQQLLQIIYAPWYEHFTLNLLCISMRKSAAVTTWSVWKHKVINLQIPRTRNCVQAPNSGKRGHILPRVIKGLLFQSNTPLVEKWLSYLHAPGVVWGMDQENQKEVISGHGQHRKLPSPPRHHLMFLCPKNQACLHPRGMCHTASIRVSQSLLRTVCTGKSKDERWV